MRSRRVGWETLARLDPLWAICGQRDNRGEGWDQADFFRSGEEEIRRALECPEGLPARFESALDFGCGVGRVTRVLAERFETCWGLDISETMIDHARRRNTDRPNCVFVVTEQPDLRRFESRSIDLVYCGFVLQHLPSAREAIDFIREFVRVVRGDGLVIFQLPHELPVWRRVQLRRRLYFVLRRLWIRDQWLYRRAHLHPISMLAINESRVRAALEEAGATVARVEVVDEANKLGGLRYYVKPVIAQP